jgi:hypothetical protein
LAIWGAEFFFVKIKLMRDAGVPRRETLRHRVWC